MAAKYNKIKDELVSQYTKIKWQHDGYYGECWKDYNREDSHASMGKAFERGIDNYKDLIEKAIKSWAKQNNLNSSNTLYQIMQQIDVENIKLK